MTDRDKFRLAGVHPTLLSHVAAILQKFPMFVVEGLRTVERQQALYAQGRTTPGKIVTNCDGIHSKSNHQAHTDGFGHACDLAFIPTHDCPDPFSPHWPWKEFGTYAQSIGLIWGGTFKLVDLDHVELPDAPHSGH